MNFFLVTPQYLGSITGSGGLYAFELSRELCIRNHKVTILTPHVKNLNEEENLTLEVPHYYKTKKIGTVKVKRFHLFDSSKIANPYEGGKEIEIKRLLEFKEKVLHFLIHHVKEKCIIHLNGHFIIPSLAKELKKYPQFKIVTSIHSLESISEAKKEEQLISKYLLHYIQEKEKEALLYSDVVIFWSQALKGEIAWMYPDIYKKSNIKVIPFGIPSNYIGERSLNPEKIILIKEKYKLTDNFIFYLGRIDPSKGIEYLIQSFPRVLTKLKESKRISIENISLVIGGLLEKKNKIYYEKLERLRHQIRDKKTRNNIHLIPDQSLLIDKEYLYRLASTFVLPVVMSPFGMSLIENIIHGTPFVASGVEGILDIVNLKKVKEPYTLVEGGAVVNFLNPIKRIHNLTEALTYTLLNKDKLKNTINPLQKRVIKKYCWEKIIRQNLTIYQQLLKR